MEGEVYKFYDKVSFKYNFSVHNKMGVAEDIKNININLQERYGKPNSKELLDMYHKYSYEELSDHLDDELLYPLTVQTPVVATGVKLSELHSTLGYCDELEPMYDSALGVSENPKYKKIYGKGILVYSGDNLLGFSKLAGAKTFIALQHTLDTEGNLLLVPGGVYDFFTNQLKLLDRDKIPYKKEFRKAEITYLVDHYLFNEMFPVRMFRFHLYGGNSYLDKLLERKKELE